jgi:hypothetical protein
MDKNVEFDAFVGRLSGLFETFGKPLPSANVIEIWFALLAGFELAQLDNAFMRHIATAKDNFPKPSDILNLLPRDPSDWPTDSVAFSDMLHVESGRFMVVTQEHVAGFEAARPLIEMRDKFNAGKAFTEKYNALVTAAKNAGTAAVWFVSSGGSDHEGVYRREAITEAVHTGRIARAQGVKMIRQMPKPLLTSATGESPALLAGPSVESHIEGLRAVLKPNYEAPVRDMAPDVAATLAAKAEVQRKIDEFMALKAREAAVAAREAAIARREANVGMVA